MKNPTPKRIKMIPLKMKGRELSKNRIATSIDITASP